MDKYLQKIYTQKDLEDMIEGQIEESINLDFKDGRALIPKKDSSLKEIAKDVSSFANSDGGIIIYGITEKDHKASGFSFVDGNSFTKETLEQVINGRIQRRLNNIVIDPVRINGKIEQTVYVVKIPKSNDAPHITSQKKYYKRFNFQSIEMEEYEIRNLYNRPEATKLQLEKPIVRWTEAIKTGEKFLSISVHWNVQITNIGNSIEKIYKLEAIVPSAFGMAIQNGIENGKLVNKRTLIENQIWHYSIPNESPIFQGERTTVLSTTFQLKKNGFKALSDNKIRLKLYYSTGVDEIEFDFIEHLCANGNELSLSSFI